MHFQLRKLQCTMSTAIYLKKVKIQAANSLTYYNENERRKHMASNGRYERGKEEGEEGIATDDRGKEMAE